MTHDDEIYNKPLSAAVWRALFPFLRPYRARILLAMSLMLICSLIDVFIPLYQKYFIDAFILPGLTDGLFPPLLLGALMMALNFLCVMALARTAISVEMGISRDLKKACFDRLQLLSISYYNKTPVGYIISRVLSDTDKIGLIIAWGLLDMMWGLAYVVFALVSMLVLEFRLGIWLVVMAPFMTAATMWFQGKILSRNRLVRRANSMITASFNEGILGARTSKTLVIEDVNIREFSGLSASMYRSSVGAALWGALYTPVIMTFGAFAVSVMLVQGGRDVGVGRIAIGTLSAMITYAVSIFEPIRHLSHFFSDATSTQANIERIDALLKQEIEIQDPPEVTRVYGDVFNPKRENWEPLTGSVRFDDVSFRYSTTGNDVLSHFNLDITAGTRVALVGETGAGKSTIVNLVCRFFEPTSGRILIDGRDYRERSQLWLRSNIGYVLQAPHLFSGSVRENIRYGRPDATEDDIVRALRIACADAVVSRLPEGLDSDVGEGGDKLSVGEKQLISFARAVLTDPRIFVLDEATSSVDTETETLIQKAIAQVLRGRTSFLIAHRLSTIREADLILVISDGKIVERGTHEELLRLGGRYSDTLRKNA
ncbi:ABC transporter ATP-binding protein [Synergistales bacterium]|nr:ABC transporter ATP-binding protein [Synergistales bacterium]